MSGNLDGAAGGGPLSGLRVVELAVYAQGPIAGALLAYLGAEVIKVEPVGGDPTRQTVTASPSVNRVGPPNGFLWDLCNSNKQSISLDLRHANDRADFHALVQTADAFVTNLMRSTLRRYESDQEALTTINPRLVYGHAGGFGNAGPLADDPCQDTVGMAYAGMMDVCSPIPGRPNYPQYALSDILSGTMMAFGVVVALLGRERQGTSLAVTTSQLQTLLWTQVCNISSLATYGAVFPAHDIDKPRSPLMNVYQAADGQWLAMGLIRAEHWDLLISILGLEHLSSDPRYDSVARRAEHSEELTSQIASAIRKRPRDDWLDAMRSVRLYVAKVNSIEDLIDDEQVNANGFIVEREDGFRTVAMPFSIDGYTVPLASPPELGAWASGGRRQ